ncbi:MAG: lamin tail domain-containing protein [Planctomycetota bacterium]|nr:lamin tail domain-containing protein [Planctomycetota bacterium]
MRFPVLPVLASALAAGVLPCTPLCAQTLSGDVSEIPLSIGGTQQLFVTAGPAFAGKTFFVGGTTSGTTPGMLVDGVLVPLNPDFYLNFTIANPNTPPLENSFGTLDSSGWALTKFTVPAGFSPSFVGTTVSHAYVIVDLASGTITHASNAVDVLLVAGPPPKTLLINEVDYDQGATDLFEYIEIYNASASDVDLSTIVLELIDGVTGLPYDVIPLSQAGPVLAAGKYLMVADPSVVVVGPVIWFGPLSDNVQDGAADGMRLVDTATGAVLDGLGYAGTLPGVTEGTSDTLFDPGTVLEASLSRCPVGSDTDDNDADFQVFKLITPGVANICE